MTSDGPSGKPEEFPDAMLEAAAAWHARLREPEGDPNAAAARRAQFDQWIVADPRHARVFEETRSLWRTLQAPVTQVMDQEPAPITGKRSGAGPFSRIARAPAMLAACLAMVMMTGVVYRHDVLIRLNADHMTSVGERTPLALADGSRVTLNTDSAISVDLEEGRRSVRLLRGEAWFDVRPDSNRPFLVETGAGHIRVTGTSFGVRLKGDAAIVSLTEGQLELVTEPVQGGVSFAALSAGQQARLSQAAISPATAFDKTQATAWLRGQLVFFDTPLSDVVADLNRYRYGRIVIANDGLDDLRISGVFTTDDPEAALNMLADTLPVRMTRLTDYLIVLR